MSHKKFRVIFGTRWGLVMSNDPMQVPAQKDEICLNLKRDHLGGDNSYSSKHLKGHLGPRVSDVAFLLTGHLRPSIMTGHLGPRVSDVTFLLTGHLAFSPTER